MLLKIKLLSFLLGLSNYINILLRQKEFILVKQLLRSETSIGALVRESEYGESKSDFIHKLHIALKEANETSYWILLLKEAEYINKQEFESMHTDLNEILKLLVSSINTSKLKLTKK